MKALARAGVFGFESDSERTLEYIPMSMRLKLDLCGLKLSLDQWSDLPLAVREAVVAARCESELEVRRLRRDLQSVVKACGLGRLETIRCDRDAWGTQAGIPPSVVVATEELGVDIGATAWRRLNDLQRFTLIKLARPGHARNLPAALAEFGLPRRR
jgi:hypothetical protein